MRTSQAESTRPKRARWLRVAYLTAVGVVAVIVLFRAHTLRSAIADRVGDGDLVNLAGRQRMLAQTIAAGALRLANRLEDGKDTTEVRADLREAATRLGRSHGELYAASPTAASASVLQELFGELQHHVDTVLREAAAIESATEAGPADEIAARILHAVDRFQPIMDLAVRTFAQDADHETAALVELEGWLSALLFAALAATVLIFEPTVRRVRRLAEESEDYQRQLDGQREDLQTILDAIPAFVFYKDDKNTILDLNRTAAQSIGRPRDEIRGRRSEDFFPAADCEAFLADDVAVIQGRQPRLGIVEEYETGGEDRKHIRTDKIPLIAPDGSCSSLVAIATDVTELSEARREIEELKSRFERAADGSSEGLWDYDPATGEVWYSDRFQQLVGRAGEPFPHVIDSWRDLLHPADLEITMAAVEAHLRDDSTPYDVEYRLRLPSGDYRWFRARGRAIRDTDGTPVRMSGSLSDIHDQRVAETRLDLATRAAQVGLWDWDVPSGQTYFSDTFYTMLGYEPGELPMTLGTWTALAHPEDLPAAMEDVQRHLDGKTEVYANEHRLKRKDGTWQWIRDIGEVVERNADGSPKRMIGVHVDVQALRAAKEASDNANQAKSEFLANMSHEIRTPMTAILGYADLLDHEVDYRTQPDLTRGAVHAIQTNGHHLLSVINDILDMSKVEAGRLAVESVDTSPIQVAEEVASLVRPAARRKGFEVRVVYDTPVPETIQSDPTRLRQILFNLAGNAVKFTDDGEVTIRVSCDVSARSLCYRVTDTGVGMSPEERDRIAQFEAFSQADASTTRKFGGSGLGLRISNALAGMLGGNLHVESELGVGSAFVATVATGDLDGIGMVSPEQVSSHADRVDDHSPPVKFDERALEGVRVLLAEDGIDNQRLISHHLRRAGAHVEVVDNGRAAVDSVGAHDLILMDMQMPELDGYGAARRLRSDGISLPIIALTAHAMAGDREKCLDAGCSDYLTKPVDRHDLVRACVEWVGRASA